jgi:hypothetical protein
MLRSRYAVIGALMCLFVLPAAAGTGSAAAATSGLPQIQLPLGGPVFEWRVEPARMQFATSLCSPVFSKLVWTSWGRTGARAHGQGLFPFLVHSAPDCATAAKQASPEKTSIVLSRPRECDGNWIFTRIGWRARGVHQHLILECVAAAS